MRGDVEVEVGMEERRWGTDSILFSLSLSLPPSLPLSLSLLSLFSLSSLLLLLLYDFSPVAQPARAPSVSLPRLSLFSSSLYSPSFSLTPRAFHSSLTYYSRRWLSISPLPFLTYSLSFTLVFYPTPRSFLSEVAEGPLPSHPCSLFTAVLYLGGAS